MKHELEMVRSVCPLDCPDTCSLAVYKEAGKIVKVSGHPDHPVTRGVICNKVRHYPERVYHPERLLHPLRRVGKKGSGEFVRISWEEAYAEIVSRFREIIATDGAEAILPYSFYGNMGILNAEGMDRRFFNRLGASHLQRTVCNAAGVAGYRVTMGASAGIDPEESVHAKLILLWGCNAVSTNIHQIAYANEARKQGAQVVVIDVHRNRTAAWADWFLPIRPGTDAALALGMMHVLIEENLIDEAFLEEHTLGFAELKEHVQNYPPVRVAEITGIPEADIVRLARLYGTTSPSYLRIGNGLQHHDNGGMIVRTLACLPALTGQWGLQGGGALKENGWYANHNDTHVQRPDLHKNPNARTYNMNQLGDALLAEQEGQHLLKALFVYNSNPAQIAPDQTKVRQGLLRDDLFTVVHDLFLTDTARYADLVLPATSHFENLDLYKSYWHLYVQLHEPVIEPLGACKSNFTLFRELAAQIGFTEDCFQVTEEQMIREALDNPDNPYLAGVTYEALQEQGWIKLDTSQRPLFPDHLPTRSGKIELYSEALLQKGLAPLPEHVPLVHDTEYPLQLVSGPNHQFLNTTFANIAALQRLEDKPTLHIHPADAAMRGIKNGDRVRVHNDRGTCYLQARVAPDVLPGVVVSQGLWWEDAQLGYQSINALTSQRLADMGGGATFFSIRVEVAVSE